MKILLVCCANYDKYLQSYYFLCYINLVDFEESVIIACVVDKIFNQNLVAIPSTNPCKFIFYKDLAIKMQFFNSSSCSLPRFPLLEKIRGVPLLLAKHLLLPPSSTRKKKPFVVFHN